MVMIKIMDRALWDIFDMACGKCYQVEFGEGNIRAHFQGVLINFDGTRAVFYTPKGLQLIRVKEIKLMAPIDILRPGFNANELAIIKQYNDGKEYEND